MFVLSIISKKQITGVAVTYLLAQNRICSTFNVGHMGNKQKYKYIKYLILDNEGFLE